MRYTVLGFSQERAIEYELDMKDLLILDWLNKFYPKMKKHIEGEQEYVWVQYKYLLEDLPILNISSEKVVGRRFIELCEKGLLTRKDFKEVGNGTFTYFGFTDKYFELFTDGTQKCSHDGTQKCSDNIYTNNTYTISFSKEKETKRTANAVVSEPPCTNVLVTKTKKPENVVPSNKSSRYTKKTNQLPLCIEDEKPKKLKAKDMLAEISDGDIKLLSLLETWHSLAKKKKRISNTELQAELEKLRGLDTDEKTLWVQNSIDNNWAGLYSAKKIYIKGQQRADVNMDKDIENTPGRGVSSGIIF